MPEPAFYVWRAYVDVYDEEEVDYRRAEESSYFTTEDAARLAGLHLDVPDGDDVATGVERVPVFAPSPGAGE